MADQRKQEMPILRNYISKWVNVPPESLDKTFPHGIGLLGLLEDLGYHTLPEALSAIVCATVIHIDTMVSALLNVAAQGGSIPPKQPEPPQTQKPAQTDKMPANVIPVIYNGHRLIEALPGE